MTLYDQVTTWTNIEWSSLASFGIYLTAISQEVPKKPISMMSLNTLTATGEKYFVIGVQIGVCCKAGRGFHIHWNAKHCSMLVDGNYLIWFEYPDINILINPFTANRDD